MKPIKTEHDPASPLARRGFTWSATYGNWSIGDPIGFGPNEAAAIQDLKDQVAEKEDGQW